LLSDERGHAMAEGVIMLPAFLLIWACINYSAQSFDKAVNLGAKTREHAWAHAIEGCQSGVPEGTEIMDATRASGPDYLMALGSALPIVRNDWPPLYPREMRYTRRTENQA